MTGVSILSEAGLQALAESLKVLRRSRVLVPCRAVAPGPAEQCLSPKLTACPEGSSQEAMAPVLSHTSQLAISWPCMHRNPCCPAPDRAAAQKSYVSKLRSGDVYFCIYPHFPHHGFMIEQKAYLYTCVRIYIQTDCSG